MSMVEIQVQAMCNMWQTITQVESTNPVGISYRLDQAQKTYGKRCRARDTKTGTIVDYRG